MRNAALMYNYSMDEIIKPLFWDVDFQALSWNEHRDFIIRRVLERGSFAMLRWLRRTVGDEGLAAWIQTHRGGGLSPRQIAYWQIALDLPQSQASQWIGNASLTIWERRTSS
jgi:hypothetical protein